MTTQAADKAAPVRVQPTDHLAALRADAEEVRTMKDAYDAALERRDKRVVDALDDGLNPGTVAGAAGISRTRVHQLLVDSYNRVRR